MPAAVEAGFREALTGQVTAQHESNRPRDVPFKGERHQVVHQTVMNMLALRQTEWNLASRLFHGIGHRNLDPALDFADVLCVRVESGFITGAEIFLQKSKFMCY